MTLQKQLQEEKHLEENQEKIQDDQPLLFSKSFSFSFSCLFSLVNLVKMEAANHQVLQEEIETTLQDKDDKEE